MDKQRIKTIGKEFFKKGLPKIGGALIKIAGAAASKTPAGAVLKEIGIFDAVADALGVDTFDEKVIEERVKGMTEEQLKSLVQLKELEASIAIAEVERESVADQEDTKRIESVNETMRAEVLGNPEAGSWRPLFGRWTCYNFYPTVYILLIIIGYTVFTNQFEMLSLMPSIVGAVIGLYTLPAAILGVASWKRGIEKIELAKGIDNNEK